MSQFSISVVIMARNEEENIGNAIASVPFASQIVVADTGSRDKTMLVARQAGAEVHSILFDGYGASKNRALEFAKCDWVLVLDADERVSPELAQGIVGAISAASQFDGYLISRLTYFLGKPVKHSGWYPDYLPRLFRNGKGKFSERLVHEKIRIDGATGRLNGLLYHHSYTDLNSYLEKLNVYSTMNAQELHRSGKTSHLLDIILHPPATFIKMYLINAGFLDGFNGFLLAALSSFSVFTKYAKLRQLDREGPTL
jgi:glycosyltransferase involved in cell wall biosynthesis